MPPLPSLRLALVAVVALCTLLPRPVTAPGDATTAAVDRRRPFRRAARALSAAAGFPWEPGVQGGSCEPGDPWYAQLRYASGAGTATPWCVFG
jgi:hypothetical protein